MTRSKTSKPKNKVQEELSRLRSEKGSTMGYIVGFELRDAALILRISVAHLKDSSDVFKLITNSSNFLEMTEDEIVKLPVSGLTEKKLLEAHRKQKAVHYSFMKEIEDI